MGGEARRILISELQLSPRLQCRVRLDEDVLKEFVQALESGDEFPAIVVFRIDDVLWVVDGHHRLKAMRKHGQAEILAVVRDGTWPDAVRAALAANQKHGIRLSAADREAAVLLAQKEFQGISTRAMASLCGVSARTVRRILDRSGGALPQLSRIQGRDGKKYSARNPRRRHQKSSPEVPGAPPQPTNQPADNLPIVLTPSDAQPMEASMPSSVAPTPNSSLHPTAIMVRNFARSSLRHHPAAAADIALVLQVLLDELGKVQAPATYNQIPQP